MRRLLLATLAVMILSGGLVFQPDAAGAQEKKTFESGFKKVKKIQEGAKVKDFGSAQSAIVAALRLALGFLAVIALAVFIYGGTLFLLSGGDPEKAKKGKSVLVYATIGLIVIGLAALAVNSVISFFSS